MTSDFDLVDLLYVRKRKEKNIPIQEYYQLVMTEYGNEKKRKESMEARAGSILGFYAVFLALFLKEVNFNQSMTLLEILARFFFYQSVLSTLVLLLLSLITRKYPAFDVGILQYPCPNLEKIIVIFVGGPKKDGIIQEYRKANDKKADYLNRSIYSLLINISIYMYMTSFLGGTNG